MDGMLIKFICSGCKEKHHFDNSKVLSLLLERRLENIYNEEEGFPIESIPEDDPSPDSIPEGSNVQQGLPLDDQLLRREIDEMLSDKVCRFLEGKENARRQMCDDYDRHVMSNLSDAKKAELTAQMNGVSKPERKREQNNPTDHGFSSELQYEWCRYKLIISLIDSADAAMVPLFTEHCVRVLLAVGPGDFHVIWVNHCATQFSGPKGHCNLHCGNNCREGYDMRNCASVVAMREIAKYFEQFTAIKFADIVKHVQCVNIREFCPTEGVKFQRCPYGTEAETNPLVGIFNIFLGALSNLKIYTTVASSAGRTCGVEELVLKRLLSPSNYVMIVTKTLWHLQFNLVQHDAKSAQECGFIMSRQWGDFSSKFMTPSLERAGFNPTQTIEEYLKDNEAIPFVTHDPKGLEDTLPNNFPTKEKIINNLLQNCMTAGPNAKVGDQVYNIQLYAQNHWSEIQERLGENAPNSWHYLTVGDILANMSKNGWEARLKNHGLLEVLKQLSDSGKKSWYARLERYDPEEVRKQMSNMGKNGCLQTEEMRKRLVLLAESGEPFWVRVKKGDVTAKKGDRMCRVYRGKTYQSFPSIQFGHGRNGSVDELRYLECPYSKNEVVDISCYTTISHYPPKGYGLKVPFGMVSKSKENGNATLMWFAKKDKI